MDRTNMESLASDALEAIAEGGRWRYGSPRENLAKIGELWNAYLGGFWLDTTDVAMMMILLKVARVQNDYTKRDNWQDIIGYSLVGWEASVESMSEGVGDSFPYDEALYENEQGDWVKQCGAGQGPDYGGWSERGDR